MAISSELAAAISVEGQLNPKQVTGILKAKATAQGDRKSESTYSSEQNLESFNHIQLDTVSITGDPLNTSLSGPEVVEYEGWIGTPKAGAERIVVGATLLVKEDWIKFSNSRLRRPGRLGSLLNSIFKRPKSKKAEQFKILLTYLTRKALQDPNETQYATLACSAFVLEPASDYSNYFSSEQDREKIVFHPALIEQFGNLPEGKHEAFVTAVIEAEASPESTFSAQGASQEARVAAPKGTVFEALRSLETLVGLPADFDFGSGFLQENVPTNTRQDLSNLGLITASKGRLIDTVKRIGSDSIRGALLYSVSQTKWFVFAANYLEQHGIRTPAKTLGQAISDEFDLDWATSSNQRNGQNVKKWVAVLYPMFADLTKKSPDFYYVLSLTSEFEGRGANPIITTNFVEEIEYLKLKGQSYNQTLKFYGVSLGAFSNWKVKNRDEAKRALEAAKGRETYLH